MTRIDILQLKHIIQLWIQIFVDISISNRNMS